MKHPIACATHGTNSWDGEVMCARDKGGCGRVWKLTDESRCPPLECGDECTCGKTLHAGNEDSPAMPICPTCFVQKWHEQQTQAN